MISYWLQPLNYMSPTIYDIVPSLSWLESHLIFVTLVSSLFRLQAWEVVISEMRQLDIIVHLKVISLFTLQPK